MKNKILDIVKVEFSSLLGKIESDFKSNYKKKRHNFLLSELDENMTAHMVFVSSFESKSGNAIQRVAKEIAILKYGIENVPMVVNPNKLDVASIPTTEREQVIVTNIDLDDSALKGAIKSFMTRNAGSKKHECTVNHETILELLDIEPKIDNKLHCKPVDLAFFDGDVLNVMEIKAGGDLDSSNAPANAEKLLTIYRGLNYRNTKPYFATIYNKSGEASGKTWSGAIKKHLQYPDMFLIGSVFWNKILPEGITFDDFTKIYNLAIKEIDLNAKLNQMISGTI